MDLIFKKMSGKISDNISTNVVVIPHVDVPPSPPIMFAIGKTGSLIQMNWISASFSAVSDKDQSKQKQEGLWLDEGSAIAFVEEGAKKRMIN